ncbi:MAG: hypothetical protein AB7F43_07640 [Bacteriovoracia bacterium]
MKRITFMSVLFQMSTFCFCILSSAAMDMRSNFSHHQKNQPRQTKGPISTGFASYKEKFLTAIERTKLICGPDSKIETVTFSPPEQTETKDYKSNLLQNTLFPIQQELLLFLKGGEKKFYIRELKKLGTFLKEQRQNDRTPYESVCRASCVINQLLNYSDSPKTAQLLLSEALKYGFGRCTHYSMALTTLLAASQFDGENQINEDPGIVNSLRHSFISVRIWDQDYYFEPQNDGRVTCNFFNAE